MVYLERLKRYLESLPESERDSAIAGLPHAAAFIADALADWRRSHKATGKPELPAFDLRHGLSLDVLLHAFGPTVDELLGIDDGGPVEPFTFGTSAAVDLLEASPRNAPGDGCQACEIAATEPPPATARTGEPPT